jgi:hypothetical protein
LTIQILLFFHKELQLCVLVLRTLHSRNHTGTYIILLLRHDVMYRADGPISMYPSPLALGRYRYVMYLVRLYADNDCCEKDSPIRFYDLYLVIDISP